MSNSIHLVDMVLAIDVSPRLINCHTCLVDRPTADQLAMATFSERVATILAVCDTDPRHAAISVDDDVCPLLDLRLYRDKRIGVCGLYGNEAVLEVGRALRARGFEVVLIEDACLWSAPLAWLLDPAKPDWFYAQLDAFPRVRAADVLGPREFEWPAPVWRGDLPHLEVDPPNRWQAPIA
jgi:hypothetical protein